MDPRVLLNIPSELKSAYYRNRDAFLRKRDLEYVGHAGGNQGFLESLPSVTWPLAIPAVELAGLANELVGGYSVTHPPPGSEAEFNPQSFFSKDGFDTTDWKNNQRGILAALTDPDNFHDPFTARKEQIAEDPDARHERLFKSEFPAPSTTKAQKAVLSP